MYCILRKGDLLIKYIGGIDMSRDREIACKSYICEGNCSKGRGGRFRKDCKTCNKYDPIRGGQPARKNLKREKNEKFNKDKRNWE